MSVTEIEFTAAHVNLEGELCLKVENLPVARKLCLTLTDKPYVAKITPKGKRRSLDANAYFWLLCGKLAESTGIPKTEIYREAIREIGGNTETVCVPTKAAERLVDGWKHNGLGWLADTTPSKLPGCTNVILYYGSSTYDTKQMSRLVDNIVQDCQAVGIETLTPEKLALLKEDWGRGQ